MRRCQLLTCGLVLGVGISATRGGVIVRLEPSDSTVQLNDQFSVTIVADIDQPVVGWGLDLIFNNLVLERVGTPSIAAPWQPVFSLDGDGLSALASAGTVSGTGVQLATLTFSAKAVGQSDLNLAITSGDATEGFPLFPTGTEAVTFINGHVTVVPEPACLMLFLLASLGGARRIRPSARLSRRRRRGLSNSR